MQAMQVMSALAQNTRLQVWTELAARLPEGMTAGEIARAMDLPKNTMSAHFAILSAAGLLASSKVGRSIIYTARTKPVHDLRDFLAATCGESGAAS